MMVKACLYIVAALQLFLARRGDCREFGFELQEASKPSMKPPMPSARLHAFAQALSSTDSGS
jgi:hypothetical protein